MSIRTALAFALASPLLLLASESRASNLAADGNVHFSSDALARYDFEDAGAFGAEAWTIAVDAKGASTGSTAFGSSTHASLVDQEDGAGAIEGHQALRLDAGDATARAVSIVDPATFATLVGKRIAVSFWGHADGMEPVVLVGYGAASDAKNQTSPWARIVTTRTGRETSDGWIEYATGAIDGSLAGKPVHDLLITGRVPTQNGSALLLEVTPPDTTAAMVVDAIEIEAAPGAVTPNQRCTAETIDTACETGMAAECVYATCVDSAAVWGPLPGAGTMAAEQEVIDRWVHYATHVEGNRKAAAAASAAWVASMNALVSTNATPRSFWSGLNEAILSLRDAHTHLGSPDSDANYFGARPAANSSALDVCFGPMQDDLGSGASAGKIGYGVFAVGGAPVGGVHLEVGDMVVAVDGMDVQMWVDQMWPRYASARPNDPASDAAREAHYLSVLLTHQASTVTIERCAAAMTSGGTPTCTMLPTIDLAAITAAGLAASTEMKGSIATCSPRFQPVIPSADSRAMGAMTSSTASTPALDALATSVVDGTTVGMQMDGFENEEGGWTHALFTAASSPHAHVLIDARQGHGGSIPLLGDFVEALRDTSSPSVLEIAARASFVAADGSALFALPWSKCPSESSCSVYDLQRIGTSGTANATFGTSKIALLDTDDVSCNDMLPLLLAGRPNYRAFAPFVTYGAVGSDGTLPESLSNWSSSSIAIADGRLGIDPASAEASTWRGGVGITPDQIVVQTRSDALANVDTIVAAARTWLEASN